VKLADCRKVAAEGIANLIIKRSDGKKVVVENVLYVLGMKCSLLSIGQLVGKGFTMKIDKDYLKLFDCDEKLVLKSTPSKNRIYKCIIPNDKIMCMSSTTNEDTDWLWHMRDVHLNFRSLNHLSSKNLVYGLPAFEKSTKTCEICMKGKQSRLPFVSDLLMRASSALDVVHSYICGSFENLNCLAISIL
jgi:hypothetical protein